MHEQQERFRHLLDHLAIEPTYRQSFEGGAIEKLIVYKKERRWHFQLYWPTIVPADAYEVFAARMSQTFVNIVDHVSFSLRIGDASFDEPLAQAYWPLSLAKIAELQSPLVQFLRRQTPRLQGQRLMMSATNEVEGKAAIERYETMIVESYEAAGFPTFRLGVEVVNNDVAIEQFRETIQQENVEKVRQAMIEAQERAAEGEQDAPQGPIVIGYQIKPDEEIRTFQSIVEEERRIAVQGYIFDMEIKELKSGRHLLTLKMTDYTSSMIVKMFSKDKEDIETFARLKKGMWVKARGPIQNDTFLRDLVMMANDLNEIQPPSVRKDTAPEKRVELHLHTPMSAMDAVSSVGALVGQAKKWGHDAIAITDHAVCQSFPEAFSAGKKNDIKILYGVEANIVEDGVLIAYNPTTTPLETATYVVFDVETTGLSAQYDTIIELAAVKIHDGQIIDRFSSFANPHHRLSATTIELTGITDDLVENAPEVAEVLTNFKAFVGDAIFVAHNASFDMGFLNAGYRRYEIGVMPNGVIDTLELGRFLYPEMKNHRLNTLCKKFDIELTQHHRAIYDAEATGYLLLKMLKDAAELGITTHAELNEKAQSDTSYKRARPFHVTLLAQNEVGLKNLFKLVSLSHIKYFFRVPRIPRSLLQLHREGILVGSGCGRGEIFDLMTQKSLDEVVPAAEFYDYLEIQPPDVYSQMIESEQIRDVHTLKQLLANIVKLGERANRPVVATGNVHYVNPDDKIYRKILISSQGGANPLNRYELPNVHFRTTDEMLAEMSFLGDEKAHEVVVTNSRLIADMVEKVKPIKDDLYTPKIEGADEEVREMTYAMARSIYGDELPEIVEARIEKELKSIIGHGFAVIYLISHKLVKKSLDDGYLVGSRGSVGSSLVATMMEITEVNPMPPHYICPKCKHSEFFNDGSVGSGFDLPNKDCPQCGTRFKKDGQDIPFETFLGFKGDKVPDIDLNFSGEYQPHAHNYTKVLFGEDNVYRAGTIGTVADKTAFGYVRGYANDNNLHIRGAEMERLAMGCTGVKRTTGQHPGGIIVVPDYMDVYDFTPIQFPADAVDAEWKTTHFDFHSIHDNLLKLDILGHDDPTVIRMLQDLSGIDPKTIPTDDPEVMKIFSGPESLGVSEEQILCRTGTYGIPEFGTRFVRQMLEDTKPSTFSELVQISGLSHGTDVWLGNAQELIHNGTCTLKDVIGCRDDIMVYLIYQGLEPSNAFKIMESVRKGKGLSDEFMEEMRANKVPEWYIQSCLKIKYMFPKAHASAYVLMAVRIAYFKVHFPILYYAAYFTVRAEDFDLDAMTKGAAAIRAKIEEINAKGLDASTKEKNLMTVLEIALEMTERGYTMKPLDLYKSDAREFKIEGNTLIPPFNAVAGLGDNVALSIVRAREQGEFLSKEDLSQRGKVSKTLIEYMDSRGMLADLPDQNQLSLF